MLLAEIPALLYFTSDHRVTGSNPLGVMFHQIIFYPIVPCACLAQFSLNNVHKGAA